MSQSLFDAKPDPMGLADLRLMLHDEAGRRWSRAAREVKRAIVAKDVLGIKAAETATPVGDKAEAFGRWLDEKLAAHVSDGWMDRYIAVAQARVTDDAPSQPVCCVAAHAAQAGIRDAVSRDASAEVAAGLLTSHRQASRIAAPVEAAIGTGLRRTRYLAEHALSQAYVQAQLDALERHGVKFVNTNVEPHGVTDAWAVVRTASGEIEVREIPDDELGTGEYDDVDLDDAARKTPQPKHPKSGKFARAHIVARELHRHKKTGKFQKQGPKEGVQAKAERAEASFAKLGGEWDVQTANDDKVCKRCQEISDNGPYSLGEARSLIPAHPNCRCVFVPAGELEDADVGGIDADCLTDALNIGQLEPA
jgi:hypothetical protein